MKRKRTKNTLAIVAVAAAMPVKPKMPAMSDIIKNTSAQYSINLHSLLFEFQINYNILKMVKLLL